jgi:hypothetical protein
VTVADGKADVPIGDGPHTLRLRLQGNRRVWTLELPERQFLIHRRASTCRGARRAVAEGARGHEATPK